MTGDPLWKVTAQRQTVILGPDGKPVNAWRIDYTTSTGVAGSLDVPLSDYSPDKVAELLTAAATTINQVHGLTGPAT